MIYTEMNGRCGNQLFHYAVARYVSIKTGDPNLSFDFKKVFANYDKQQGRYDVLTDYQTVPYSYWKGTGKLLFQESNLLQKAMIISKSLGIYLFRSRSRAAKAKEAVIGQRLLNHFGVYWVREGVDKIWPYPRKKSIVSGPCEVSFIYEIKDICQKEIQPKASVLPKNIVLINKIKNSNYVCVSVRRGDFFNNQNAKSFAVCTPDYYRMAKKKLENKKLKNLTFFVFSDDIDWCKKELDFNGNNVIFVSQDMPVYETLRLMYTCKHFILSNSTFSWWGQFLSRAKNKLVVSPSRWNNDGYQSKLIQKNWILINC